jgi:hypothetical protein
LKNPLLGAFAPAARASPICDSAVLPVRKYLNASRPPRGTGGAKGGLFAVTVEGLIFHNYQRTKKSPVKFRHL